MNEDINIAEILKDAPNNTRLYSPIYGIVRFDRLRTDNKTIEVSVDNTYKHFDYYGRAIWHNLSDVMLTGEECLLFPSKENRDWLTFKAPKKHKHFEPFQKVLVRTWTVGGYVWRAALYGNYDELCNCYHLVGDIHVCKDDDIIPYEGNEYMLGKKVEE